TAADVKPHLKWIQGDYPGIYGRKLTFSEGHLFIFVSEFDLDTKIEVQDPITKVTYQFTIAPGRAVMYATDVVGKVSATYRPDEVSIQEKERTIAATGHSKQWITTFSSSTRFLY